MQMQIKYWLAYFASGLLILVASVWQGVTWAQSASPIVDQLILKYQPNYQLRLTEKALQARVVVQVTQSTGLPVRYKRAMSPATDAHVVKLPYAMPLQDAKLYARNVMQQHPDIAYVEPDTWRVPLAVQANDSEFAQQWYTQPPQQYAGAANFVNAWSVSKGSRDIVVAVLDSGITAHADLQANLVGGKTSLSGFDMVDDAELANDGDGRDADPSDPGVSNDAANNSDWHGTHIAGIVAATPDNEQAIAGTAWQTRLLNVRIMSDQGGYLSDQVDGMLWAAGESVPGVPENANPAHILNLSVGTDYFLECSNTEQQAIQRLRELGVAVVVAAGNENRNVEGSAPANCNGAITVTGVMRDGARAPFANYGTGNVLAAPADTIYSTYNTGVRAPEADSVFAKSGTSQAAPQVASTLALMLAANERLLDDSVLLQAERVDFLAERLQQTARAFPVDIDGADDIRACNLNQKIACVCSQDTCGAGLLDAAQAVRSVSTAPQVKVSAPQTVQSGQTVTLDGSASHDDEALGGSITTYAWTQVEGDTLNLQDADRVKAQFTAPDSEQGLRFQLSVTDDSGLTASKEVAIQVKEPTAQNTDTGGGGSVSWLLLSLLLSLGGYCRLRSPCKH